MIAKTVIGGYNLSCIGDDRQYSCMLSKYENTPSDTAIIEAFKKLKINKTNNLTTVIENAAPHKNMLTGAGEGAI